MKNMKPINAIKAYTTINNISLWLLTVVLKYGQWNLQYYFEPAYKTCKNSFLKINVFFNFYVNKNSKNIQM